MTGPSGPTAREFHAAAGGEVFEEPTQDGNHVVLAALPIPDGTVRLMVTIVIPGIGPFGLQVVLTADQAARIGEMLTRVAGR
ncbi:hypothetical protein [Klenkia brasiliensis]|uniref:Uncharacterized protein n=1 Tax=Klenkia brasiliensis TaxID=333142 RepID=A0A1G7YI42_9ACTN|nr:hypothetical protein [Klenkia brasiliensis]SDG96044.1 hypothetical protein SAMN05660324_3966 [Klenkia brasiliensis]